MNLRAPIWPNARHKGRDVINPERNDPCTTTLQKRASQICYRSATRRKCNAVTLTVHPVHRHTVHIFFVFEPQVSLLWAGERHRRCCLLCLLKTRSSSQVRGRGLFIRGRARTDTAGGFTRVATMRCTPFDDTNICRVDLCGLLLANGVQDTQRRSLTRAADENRASPGDVAHALFRA